MSFVGIIYVYVNAMKKSKPKSKQGHLSVRQGKKVRVLLIDGQTVIDRFIEKKGKLVIFEKLGKVPVKNINGITIYKPLSHER